MLTEEELAKVEANRRKALTLRALRQQQQAQQEQEQQQAETATQANCGGSGRLRAGAGVQELMAEGGFTREEAQEEGGDDEHQSGGTVTTPAPPAQVALALANSAGGSGGGCEACGSSMVDEGFRKVFGLTVCHPCKAARDEDYGLLSKGEAMAEYCLQEGTIRMMPCLERRNPRHGKFNAMKLYCRKQLRAKAHERWGDREGLEEELERRRRRKYETALGKTVDVFAKKRPRP